MVKFRQSVDVARQTFSEVGADSEFEFGETYLDDLLTVAWTHKSDAEPRKEARKQLLDLVKTEAGRRGRTHGD